MDCINGATFEMAFDKGRSHFHDLNLHDCTFDNCGLSMVKIPENMSRVQGVRISKCRAVNSEIMPCIFEDVVVEELSTNPILLVWAGFFRRVKLVGKIGKLNLNLAPTAFCKDVGLLERFETARAAFYAQTDWALDISEAKLLGLRCEGVPLHLIKRDPQTQVIVDKGGRYAGHHALEPGFAQAFPLAHSVLQSFDASSDSTRLLTVSLAAPKARRDEERGAIAELRTLGFLED
jgi:hypothetical protein